MSNKEVIAEIKVNAEKVCIYYDDHTFIESDSDGDLRIVGIWKVDDDVVFFKTINELGETIDIWTPDLLSDELLYVLVDRILLDYDE